MGLSMQRSVRTLRRGGRQYVNRFDIDCRAYKVIPQNRAGGPPDPDPQGIHVTGPGGKLIPLSPSPPFALTWSHAL